MYLVQRSKTVEADDALFVSMGFARLAESSIRSIRGKGEKDSLSALDKIIASSIGGALATWNQPIEVIRVEVSLSRGLPPAATSITCLTPSI